MSIEDALVDLLLLRATDYFAGTRTSSFSELVVVDRPHIPHALPGEGRRRDLLLRYSGAEAIVVGLGWLGYRRVMPASAVLYYLRKSASRRLALSIRR